MLASSHKSSYRSIVIFTLLICAGLLVFESYSPDNNLFRPPKWTPEAPLDLKLDGTSTPILGEHEDLRRLYYPPMTGQLKQFRLAKYVEYPATRPRTPLFISFTNNNDMLIQCVLSYIAAGWPPSDIIIVENTPTMDSNMKGKLTRDNYFFMDYPLLRSYGVSILQTPVLFTFSQLQNFYIRTALAYDWPNFFWSHMDVVVLGDEAPPMGAKPFKPFYHAVIDVVKSVQNKSDWAIKWFSCTMGTKACDMLVLVNVAAWVKIGAWDPFIPYYITDCDAFSRMVLNGYTRKMAGDHEGVGHIFDVGTLLDKPEKWLFPETADEQPNSKRFQRAFKKLEEMEHLKLGLDEHRNDWQENHGNGKSAKGDWGYDQKAFRAGWWALSDAGRGLYEKKWGTDRCELEETDVKLEHMWRPLHEEQRKAEQERKKEEAEKKKESGG